MNRRHLLFKLLPAVAFGGLNRFAFGANNDSAGGPNEVFVTTVISSRITSKKFGCLDDFWSEHDSYQSKSLIFRFLNSTLRGDLIHQSISHLDGNVVYVRKYKSVAAYKRHMTFVSRWLGGTIERINESNWQFTTDTSIARDSIAFSRPKTIIETSPS